MYMPLCRQCHERESKFNEAVFIGDPTNIGASLDPLCEDDKFKGLSITEQCSTESEIDV